MSSAQSGKKSKASRKKRGGAKEVYCFCRQPQGGRFMIACDSCDQWYHGTCVGVTKAEGDGIECWYCDTCTSATPNLKIIYKEPKEPDTKGRDPNAIPQRCKDCLACCTQPDCGTCARCKAKNGRCLKVICVPISKKTQADINNLGKPSPPKEPKDEPMEKPMIEPKVEPNDEEESEPKDEKLEENDDETYSPPSASRKAGGGGVAGSAKRGKKKGGKAEKDKAGTKGEDKVKGGAKRDDKEKQPKTANKGGLADRIIVGSEEYKAHMEKERNEFLSEHEPVQCLGPRCIFEARPGSKYCSHACGLKLARDRIETSLPRGVDNFYRVTPVAVNQARQREIIKEKLRATLNKEKAEMDKCYKMMIDYVQALDPFLPSEEDGKADGDFVVACPVCAAEFGCKVIGRHIDKCNARSEKQTTYGTDSKCVVNPDGIYCDEFNKINKTYCKRLRVICPEHYKGDIEEGAEVCGYPKAWFASESMKLEQLFTSVDEMMSEGFCGAARKECKKHFGWIPMTLGLIDNHRLTYYQKMDELAEKKSPKIGDALLLMSNRTEYHQPLEKILDKYEKGAKTGGETVMATLL